MKSTDIQVKSVEFEYHEYHYRTPIKFGGVALDRATILDVRCDVETRDGKRATGFGSMPLSNVWAFPSRTMPYEQTLSAMQSVAERVARLVADCPEYGHPVDLTWQLEPSFHDAAAELSDQLRLDEPIPALATLVSASPFDAALHDAYGKAHGLNCYHTYGPEFMNHDLGHFLGEAYSGETLDRYVNREPQPWMPVYHLIGALDPLDEADIDQRINDGLPETLPEWIRADGLTHLKIKLNGDDLNWDVTRVVRIDEITTRTQEELGVREWYYSLDFNERCENVEYLLEMLARVRAQRPQGFERIQYIEQPTARNLHAHQENVMHEASRIRPVVIDESLTDLESLLLARDMGYTGAALKACKGQTQSLLLGAAAQKLGMFLCVQDLTCPGASLIHSAGLAAHIPGVAAIEANARQYVPEANRGWEDRFPGIFRIRNGRMQTGLLTGPGLGAVP